MLYINSRADYGCEVVNVRGMYTPESGMSIEVIQSHIVLY